MEIIQTNESSETIKANNIKENLITNLEGDKTQNDLEFWENKWFKKIPNWEAFAKWWFQRKEIIILINIFIELLKVEENGKFNIEYWMVVNHFVRNGSHSTLIWENNKKKLAYNRFVYLINLIKRFNDNQRLSFLNKLTSIHLQNIRYPKWSNRIEVMIWGIENNQLYDN